MEVVMAAWNTRRQQQRGSHCRLCGNFPKCVRGKSSRGRSTRGYILPHSNHMLVLLLRIDDYMLKSQVTSHERSPVARCRRIYAHAHDYHIYSISNKVQVHEYLRPKLCDVYENDSIFDKFECCLSGDGLRVAPGSYSNLFRVLGCLEGSTEARILEPSVKPMRRQGQTPFEPFRSLSTLPLVLRQHNSGIDANGNAFDFTTKLLHFAWHPTENLIACAASNSLYMYYA